MKNDMLIEERIIAALIGIMVLLVAAQVVSRYVLHASLSHTEEIVRYLFVWSTFLGIAAAARRKKHLSLSLADRFLPDRLLVWTKRAAGLGALIFAAVITFYGFRVVLLQVSTRQTTAALGMPMWLIGLALPVCALALVIRIILPFFTERGRS